MSQTQTMPGVRLRGLPGNSLIPLARQAKTLDEPLPCRREDPQLWFAELPSDLELVKAYCGPCPIRGLCLAGAVERREPHGVWGGELFASGVVTAHKRPRGRPRHRSRDLVPAVVQSPETQLAILTSSGLMR